jgi:hypothetical protein
LDIIVYTDSLEINGKVGAAASLYINGRLYKTIQYHLGSSKYYGIPEAKLVGEILATHLLITTQRQFDTATIAPDNVGTIQAMQNQHPRPGHYLLDILLRQMDKLSQCRPRAQITFRWMPGHAGVLGNKYVDGQAKRLQRVPTAR